MKNPDEILDDARKLFPKRDEPGVAERIEKLMEKYEKLKEEERDANAGRKKAGD